MSGGIKGRTVTTVVAIESIVEGDGDASTVAQTVLMALTLPDVVRVSDATEARPRAVGLIESSERIVNPDEWGG